jgi:hypothetical protein
MNALLPTFALINSEPGELHREGRALSFSEAFDVNRATVQFHQMTHDRQPQAEASMLPHSRPVRLSKALEDEGQKLRADTLTGAADEQA